MLANSQPSKDPPKNSKPISNDTPKPVKCILSEEESDGDDTDTVIDNDPDTDNKPIQPTEEMYNIVTGAVNDVQASFMLDSSASMVCVPEEPDDQWLPKTT